MYLVGMNVGRIWEELKHDQNISNTLNIYMYIYIYMFKFKKMEGFLQKRNLPVADGR